VPAAQLLLAENRMCFLTGEGETGDKVRLLGTDLND
jgi:hypothetical protein